MKKLLAMVTVAVLGLSLGATDLVVNGTNEKIETDGEYDLVSVRGGGTLTITSGAKVSVGTLEIATGSGTGTVLVQDGAEVSVTNHIYLSRATTDASGLSGALRLTDATLKITDCRICFGDGCSEPGAYDEIVLNEGGVLYGSFRMCGSHDAYVRWNGGELRAQTIGGSLVSAENVLMATGKCTFESVDGKTVAIDMNGQGFYLFTESVTGEIVGTGDFLLKGKTNTSKEDWAYSHFFAEKTSNLLTGKYRIEVPDLRLIMYANEPHEGCPVHDFVLTNSVTLDMNGHTFAARTFDAAGVVVTNTASGAAKFVLDNDVATSLDANFSENVEVDTIGTAAVTLNSLPKTFVTKGAGVVTLPGRPADHSYRHYRFVVDQIRTPSTSHFQFSELKLYNGDQDVTQARNGIQTGDVEHLGLWEDATKVVDGDLGSKWCQPASIVTDGNAWIQLDYADRQKVTSYEWYTANDADVRDPVSWRLFGSLDGETWHLLSQVEMCETVPTDRQVRAGTWTPSDPPAATAECARQESAKSITLNPGSTLVVAKPRELGVSSFVRMVGATCAFEDGVSFRCGDDTVAQGLVFGLAMDGTGGLRKVGSNTVTAYGDNSYSGPTRVESGELRFSAHGSNAKYWRWTCKKVARADNCLQFSEFKLFDSEGQRLGLNSELVAVDAVLQPGQVKPLKDYSDYSEDIGKLFDGNTATKWCSYSGVRPTELTPDDPDTWRGFMLRLPEDAAPVVYYNLTLANDAIGQRDPVTWTLEFSADGETWVMASEVSNAITPGAAYADYNDGLGFYPFGYMTDGVTAFPPSSVVSVAAGATLTLASGPTRIGALEVDCAGAGTINGFVPAQSGVLNLVNLPAGAKLSGLQLPLTIVTPDAAVPSLDGWTVSVNGVPTRKRIRLVGDKLEIVSPSLLIMLR